VRCNRLEAGLLAALEWDEVMNAHVAQCEDCREHLRGYSEIARLIGRPISAAQR
jgi:hypothetical protein